MALHLAQATIYLAVFLDRSVPSKERTVNEFVLKY